MQLEKKYLMDLSLSLLGSTVAKCRLLIKESKSESLRLAAPSKLSKDRM